MLFETIRNIGSQQFLGVGLIDVVDILIVAFIVYQAIQFIAKTRAASILKGILFLVLLLQVGELFNFGATSFLLRNTMQLGLVAIIVVFQPELRSALERMGRGGLRGAVNSGSFFGKSGEIEGRRVLNEVSFACERLSARKTGALIVFERKSNLGETLKTGIMIDAEVTAELLETIFFSNTPLHDGAVLISEGRVAAASCLLPLTQDQSLSKELGTRHRAAIGLSEICDALVVVVSEETGVISIVADGVLRRGYNGESLYESLYDTLIGTGEESLTLFERLFRKAEA